MRKRLTITATAWGALVLASSVGAQPPTPPEARPLAEHYIDTRDGLPLERRPRARARGRTEPSRRARRAGRGARPARASRASAESHALAGAPRRAGGDR